MKNALSAVLVVIAGLLLLLLAFLILRLLLDGTRYAVAAAVSGAHTGTFSVGGTGPQMYGPYTITGTAIMDASHGTPAVPFIEYLNTHNATSTKQLVYYGVRACAPEAGDIPCVPPYHTTDGYPLLSTGERITVTGYIYEDRFLITSLNVNS